MSKTKKRLVVLTGAGISAESGIATFRDSNGLWEGHDVMEVASPQGWEKDKQLVTNFYNKRRAQLHTVKPNAAHELLAQLESDYDVYIITQNVDDLHERAGSTQVTHLHGELKKVRSTLDDTNIKSWDKDVTPADLCAAGAMWRPHIVWFGEEVPAMDKAIEITQRAHIFITIGTSLQVYPAAGLMDFLSAGTPRYYIDKNPAATHYPNLKIIEATASQGMQQLMTVLGKNE